MSDQDVFDSTKSTTETNVGDQDIFQEQLSGIKDSEGNQKYKDVPTALNSIVSAQEHIAKLEKENQALRDSQDKLGSMHELLESIASARDDNQAPAQQARDGQLNEDAIKALMESAINESYEKKNLEQIERDQALLAQNNSDKVRNSLVEKFGSTQEASKEFHKVAQEAGMTTDELLGLGKTNPGVVLKLFETKTKPTQDLSSVSGFNTSAILNNRKIEDDPITVDTKRILSGPSKDKSRTELMKQIMQNVYERNGITT
jgi:hypothetical protein